ncbi:type II secretion system F family protein [Candidatus Poriferisocius sp.]|uniref:type II secretion system F family protein n=1 Tax=Candidatus Poriferisocius sp. TaxID=3101276 RepID=UPI003B52BE29
MFWLIVIIVVACMAVAGVLVFRSTRNAQVLDQRLVRVRTWAVAVYGEPQKRRKQKGEGFSLRLVSSALLNVLSGLVPVGAAERAKLKDAVTRAGFHRPDALSIFMTVKLTVMLSGGILLSWQVSAGQWLGEYTSTPAILLVGLAGAVVGGILPETGLDRLGARRQGRMAAALPDALDLMTLCLESGLTFERTLSRVARELGPMAPDLAREFTLSEAELRLGTERKNVLHDLHVRTGVEGLRDLSSTITQGERYGTPLAQSMRNIAHSERQQRAARIEVQVARLPVLMSMPMLLLVTPGTLLLVAGPAFISTMEALGNLG